MVAHVELTGAIPTRTDSRDGRRAAGIAHTTAGFHVQRARAVVANFQDASNRPRIRLGKHPVYR